MPRALLYFIAIAAMFVVVIAFLIGSGMLSITVQKIEEEPKPGEKAHLLPRIRLVKEDSSERDQEPQPQEYHAQDNDDDSPDQNKH